MMINKMIKCLVLLLVFSGGLKAQNWVENGDRFVYSLFYMAQTKYVMYEVEKDTVVAGDSCKLFSSTIIEYVGPAGGSVNDHFRTDYPGPDYYFKTVGDSVFWFDGNQFVFTFPLDAPIGYQWNVPQNPTIACDTSMPPPADLHQVTGHQTGTLSSGQTVDILFLQSQGDWFVGGTVYVDVGPSGSLFPIPGASCSDPSARVGKPFKLSCRYISSTGNTENYGGGPGGFCSDMLLQEEEPFAAATQQLNIYPNPFDSELYIEMPAGEQWHLQIHNVLGQQLFEQQIRGNTVDVSGLAKGIYIITVEDSKTGKLVGTEKMMKL